MSIDASGTALVGSDPTDIEEYLRLNMAASYPVIRTVHAQCACGHDVFTLLVDADEGCAQRVCAACRTTHLICDSDESWDDAAPATVACPCSGTAFQVAVGFSHRGDGSINWITIGHRCTSCGALASSADWRVSYTPTDHLYAQV